MTENPTTAVAEVPLSDLRPHPRNPRRISPLRLEQLKRNLEADRGMLGARPVIALPDGTVIAGNQRLRAAAELGWDSIPTVYADLDAERAAVWALRDNRGFGEDDDEMVAALLTELAAAGVDLDLTGYASSEIDALLAASARRTVDPDDAPPLPAGVPDSKPGEIYDLGPHLLICGDATEPDTLAALVDGQPVELVWTDPPYGVEYVGKTADALTISGDHATGICALLIDVFRASDPVMNSGARFYVAFTAGPNGFEARKAINAVGWTFHQALVWVKGSMVLGHSDYHYQHEDVLYGWKPGPGRIGRGAHEGTRWYGGNAQVSVFEFPKPARSAEHPTMKPVGLIEAQIRNSSQRGDVILDPFAGSGSTIIAAELTGRRCFAAEIDPAYCDVIRQRYAAYTAGD